MQCERCGENFPSPFYFHGEARGGHAVCNKCWSNLGEEERAKNEAAERAHPPEPETEAIGGWLLLFSLNFLFTVPASVYTTWIVPLRAVRERPSLFAAAALLYSVVFCALLIWSAVRFFSRRRRTGLLMAGVLIAYAAFWALNGTLWDFVVRRLAERGRMDTEEFLAEQFVGALAGCLVWIPYFLVSRRVRGTFVR